MIAIEYDTTVVISQVLFLRRLCGSFKKSGPGTNVPPIPVFTETDQKSSEKTTFNQSSPTATKSKTYEAD